MVKLSPFPPDYCVPSAFCSSACPVHCAIAGLQQWCHCRMCRDRTGH